MSKRFALFVSWLFHPLLFPTYATLLIIAVNPHLFAVYNIRQQMLWAIITFVFTFICPLVWLAMMKRLELISDFKMVNPRERIIPYIAVATFYLWMYRLFKPSAEPTPYSNEIISLMMLGASLSIFIGFFINIFSRICIHAIAMGAFLGLTLSLMRLADFDLKYLFVALLLLAGLVGSARILLAGHREEEVWTGYITGFLGQFISFILVHSMLHF